MKKATALPNASQIWGGSSPFLMGSSWFVVLKFACSSLALAAEEGAKCLLSTRYLTIVQVDTLCVETITFFLKPVAKESKYIILQEKLHASSG